MRRAVPVLILTLAALALIAGFHTTAEPLAVTVPRSSASSSSTTTASTMPPAAGSAPPAGTGSPTTSASSARRSFTGPEVDNRYGPVQVRITVQASRVVDVVALQLPSDRPHSERLSSMAGPQLRSEALRAQSARIDVVSGATFTSESYAQSLQSALDAAGLRS